MIELIGFLFILIYGYNSYVASKMFRRFNKLADKFEKRNEGFESYEP